MSDRDDSFYRRQADDALSHADRATNPADRAAWLRLAEEWLSLVRTKMLAEGGQIQTGNIEARFVNHETKTYRPSLDRR